MPIDIALLGCAHPHVSDVLGVIASEPDVRLVASWDADPAAIPAAISGTAVARAETAISRANAVVICAPTDQRPALAVTAARAGAPVLIEKPIARTAAEARLVARELARTRTPVLPALHLRELPALSRLRGVVRERLLGRLTSIRASQAHAGLLEGWFRGPTSWMRDPARAGVGGFGDLGLDLVDAVGLLGRDEPVLLGAVVLDHDGTGEVGGTALGSFAGVPLTIHTSWAERPGGLEIVVAGSSGTATLRDGVLELARSTGSPERWVGGPPDAGEAMRAFAGRLRARRVPTDVLAAAVEAQAVVERAMRVG